MTQEQTKWLIKNEYDCYYKNDYKNETGTAFEYIRNIIRKGENMCLESFLNKKVKVVYRNGESLGEQIWRV